MKGKFKFTVFLLIFAVLFGACLYVMAYAANISEEIAAGTYTDSFWSASMATIAVWIFAALSILAAAGIISCILKSKAAYIVFIIFFAALFALSGYLGFLHLKNIPYFNVTSESVFKLIIYIVLIVISVVGIIVNMLALRRKPKF